MEVQEFCVKDGARVFSAIYKAIEDYTLVREDLAETLARDIANAHMGVAADLLMGATEAPALRRA